MTNKEKYLDELMKIWETGNQFGIFDGKPDVCVSYKYNNSPHKCSDCIFYSMGTCTSSREEWLKKECGVKASTLPVDTRIVLHSKDTGRTINRYFSHVSNYCIYYFCSGSDSWTSEDIGMASVSESGSYTVTLEDGTPVLFE